MFIISRLCFPRWRHWCPGVAWVSQWCVVVPPTLYPTWWWPVRKRPKHAVGTLLYIQT